MTTKTKKKYMTPKMESYEMQRPAILAGSGVMNDKRGIGYGGVDDDGDMEVD